MHRHTRTGGKQRAVIFHRGTLNEAIELNLEGRSPYPERSTFVDADSPTAGREIRRAADQGLAVVLVSADCATQTLSPVPVASE